MSSSGAPSDPDVENADRYSAAVVHDFAKPLVLEKVASSLSETGGMRT